jgi:hypothetical protein
VPEPLQFAMDWRWMTHREDNPWYPSTRIFCRQQHMAWVPVFERKPTELCALLPGRARTRLVKVEIAPGELIDKITIREIKAERITDAAKLRNVLAELATLSEARDASNFDGEVLAALTAELEAINESLWRIEDEIRECERSGDFGPTFIELARSVYETNDRRAAVSRP